MTCSKSDYCVHYDRKKCSSPDEHKNCEYWQKFGVRSEEAAKRMFCRVRAVKIDSKGGKE